jgi:hypothetical protein
MKIKVKQGEQTGGENTTNQVFELLIHRLSINCKSKIKNALHILQPI